MSGRLTRKRRASLKLRVEEMNEALRLKSRSCETSNSLGNSSQPDSSRIPGHDDTLELPAPLGSDEDYLSSDDGRLQWNSWAR